MQGVLKINLTYAKILHNRALQEVLQQMLQDIVNLKGFQTREIHFKNCQTVLKFTLKIIRKVFENCKVFRHIQKIQMRHLLSYNIRIICTIADLLFVVSLIFNTALHLLLIKLK